MKAAPKGRKHSKKRKLIKIKRKLKKLLFWPSFLANKARTKKFFFQNKHYSTLQSNVPITRVTIEPGKRNSWIKRVYLKVLASKTKNKPLLIISIRHQPFSIKPDSYNDAALRTFNRSKADTKIECLVTNRWNTVLLSNRQQKLRSLNARPYEEAAETNNNDHVKMSNSPHKNKDNHQNNHQNTSTVNTEHHENPVCALGSEIQRSKTSTFPNLNHSEKLDLFAKMIPSERFDVKYNFYYGTNVLKTVCVPISFAESPASRAVSPLKVSSADSSVSSEYLTVLQLDKDISIRLPSKKQLSHVTSRSATTRLRKTLRLKLHSLNHTSFKRHSSVSEAAEKGTSEKCNLSQQEKTLSQSRTFDPFS